MKFYIVLSRAIQVGDREVSEILSSSPEYTPEQHQPDLAARLAVEALYGHESADRVRAFHTWEWEASLTATPFFVATKMAA